MIHLLSFKRLIRTAVFLAIIIANVAQAATTQIRPAAIIAECVFTNESSTYSSGTLQTFAANGSTAAGIKITPAASSGAPSSGAHTAGELHVDSLGVLYVCSTSGTPGTWASAGATAGTLNTISEGGTALSTVATLLNFDNIGFNLTLDGTTVNVSHNFGSDSGTVAQGSDVRFNPSPSTAGTTVYDNGSAWIALAAGSASQVYQYGGSNAPTWVTFSGDATIAEGGAITIAANAIGSSEITDGTVTSLDVTTDVSNRLHAPGGIAGDISYSDGTNWLRLAKGSNSTVLSVSSGGVLGYATVTSAMITDATIVAGDLATALSDRLNPAPSGAGKVVYDNGTAYVAASAGSSNTILHGGSAPSFSAIVSADITDGTITDSDVATANKDGTAGTLSLRTLGTTSTSAAAGNDSRFLPTPSTAGNLPYDNGTAYTTLSIGVANRILYSTGTAPAWADISGDATFSAGTVNVTDLTITSEATDDLLKFNGTNWVKLAKGSNSTALTVDSGGTLAYTTVTSAMITDATIVAGDLASSVTGLLLPSGTSGDLVYYNGAAWVSQAVGTASQFLQVNGSTVPAWVSMSGDATLSNGVLTIASNAIGTAEITDGTVSVLDVTTDVSNRLHAPGGVSGDISYSDGTNWLRLAKGSNSTVLSVSSGGTLGYATVTSAMVTDSTLVAGDLATTVTDRLVPTPSAAGITVYDNGTAWTALAAGSSNQLYQANGAAAPSWVTVGGDITNSGGTMTIASNAIGSGEITDGSVTVLDVTTDVSNRLHAPGGVAGDVSYSDGTNWLRLAKGSNSTVLSVSSGGTLGYATVTSAMVTDGTLVSGDLSSSAGITSGQILDTTIVAGDLATALSDRLNPSPSGAGKVVYDNGTAYVAATAGTSTQVLHGGTTPSFSDIVSGDIPDGTITSLDVTTDVSNRLHAPGGVAGDISYSDGTNWLRLAKGSNSTVLSVSSGGILGYATVTSAMITDATITSTDLATSVTGLLLPSGTTGDLVYYNGAAWVNLGIGTPGQVVKVAGGVPTWGTDTVGEAGGQTFDGDLYSTSNGYLTSSSTTRTAVAVLDDLFIGNVAGTRGITHSAVDTTQERITGSLDITDNVTASILFASTRLHLYDSAASPTVVGQVQRNGNELEYFDDTAAREIVAKLRNETEASGDLLTHNGTTWLSLVKGSNSTVLSVSSGGTLGYATVTSAMITDATVAVADVTLDVSSRLIPPGTVAGDTLYNNGTDWKRLAIGSATQISQVNGSNAPTWVTFSGDATIAEGGAITIAANAIGSSEITDGTVSVLDVTTDVSNRLHAPGGVAGDISYSDGTNWLRLAKGSNSTVLAVDSGGTLAYTTITSAMVTDATLVAGDMATSVTTRFNPTPSAAGITVYDNGTAWTALAAGSSNQLYQANGAAAPSWVTVAGDLTQSGGTFTIASNAIGSSEITDGSVTVLDVTTDVSNRLHAPGGVAGDISYSDGTNWLRLAKGSNSTVLSVSSGGTLGYATVTSAMITDATITSTDLASSVTGLLLPSGTSGDLVYYTGATWAARAIGTASQILQVNGSTVPAWVTASGDATISDGVITIAANAVGSSEITDGSVTVLDVTSDVSSRLHAPGGVAGDISYSDGTNWLRLAKGSNSTVLSVSSGGTLGYATVTSAMITDATIVAGDLASAVTVKLVPTPSAAGITVYDNGTAWTALAAGSSNQLYQANGAAAPSWVTVAGDLTQSGGTFTIASNAIGSSEITDGSVTALDVTTDVSNRLHAPGGIAGDISYSDGTNWLRLAKGSNSTVLQVSSGGTLQYSTVTEAMLASAVSVKLPPTPATAGKIIYDNGTAYVAATAGTTSQVLIGGTAPAFGNVPVAAGQEIWALADLSDVTSKSGSGTVVLMQDTPTITTPVLTNPTISNTVTFTDNVNAANSVGTLVRTGPALEYHDGTASRELVMKTRAETEASGDLLTHNGTTWLSLVKGSNSTVLSVSSGGTLGYATITSAMVTDSTLVSGDMATSVTDRFVPAPSTAGITVYDNGTAWTALAAGTSGQLYQYGGSNAPTWVSMSGDATIAAGGAITIASNAIGSSEITDGSVTVLDVTTDVSNRLHAPGGIAGDISYSDGTNWLRLAKGSNSTVLSVSSAGTLGYATVTSAMITDATIVAGDLASTVTDRLNPTPSGAGKVVYDNGTAYVAASAGTATTVLHGGTTPSFSAIVSADITDGTVTVLDVTSDVSTRLLPPGAVQGDIVYHNGSDWQRLAAGITGQLLKTNGTGADPAWTTLSGTTIIVQEGGSTVSTASLVNFDASDFNVSETPTENVTVALAYGSSIGTPAQGSDIRFNPTPSAAGITVYDNGTAWTALAAGSSNQLYQANGAAAPSWVTVGGDITNSGGTMTIASNAIGSSEITDGSVTVLDVTSDVSNRLHAPGGVAGDISYSDGTNWLRLAKGSNSTVLSVSSGGTLGYATVTSAMITDATIVAGDLASELSARLHIASPTPGDMEYYTGFVWTALSGGDPGKILQYTTAAVPTWTTMGGDATIAEGGAVTIAANAIGSSEITDGTITSLDVTTDVSNRLHAPGGIAGDISYSDGTNWLRLAKGSNSTVLSVSSGGTLGYATVTSAMITDTTIVAGDLAATVTARLLAIPSSAGITVYDNGTAWTALAAGSSNQLYQANGAAAPSWVTVGGDITNSGGTMTIAANAVGSSEITDGSVTVLDVTTDVSNRLHAPGGVAGDISYSDGTNWLRLAKGSNSTVLSVSSGGTLGYATITSAMVTDATLVAGDMATSVTDRFNPAPSTAGRTVYDNGTAWTALAAGTSGQMFQYGGSNAPTWVSMSGDATIAAGGAITIASNAIGTAEITDGTVSVLDVTTDVSNRLHAPGGVAGDISYSDGTNWLRLAKGSNSTVLSVSSGGVLGYATVTSAMITDATIVAGDLASAVTVKLVPTPSAAGITVYDNGTAWTALAAGSSNQLYQANGAAAPSWVTVAGDVTQSGGTFTIASNAIGSSEITDGSVTALDVTTDVSNRLHAPGGIAGDISYSDGTNWKRLPIGTSAQFLQTNGSSAPTWASFSSDMTVAVGGAVTIASNAIGSAEITDGTVSQLDCTADVSNRLHAPGGIAGDISYSDGTNWLRLAKGSNSTVLSVSSGGTLGYTTVTSAMVTDATLVADDMASTVTDRWVPSPSTAGRTVYDNGTAWTALAAGTSGQMFQYGGSNAPTWVSMSGDATIATGGALTIAANAIGSSEITDGSVTVLDVTTDVSNRLMAPGGVAGDIAYSDGTNWKRLAKGSDTTVLTLASGIPSWAAPSAPTTTARPPYISGGYVTRVGTNLVFQPDVSNRVYCYESATWTEKTITAAGITTGATGKSASTLYYMYVYDNSGTMTVELSTTSNVTQDGIAVKSGATNRTLIAICYSNASGNIETRSQNAATQNVYNIYNRREIFLYAVETATTWDYSSATWRPLNNSTANACSFVAGGVLQVRAEVDSGIYNSGNQGKLGLGYDRTNGNDAVTGNTALSFDHLTARWWGVATLGSHTITAVESSTSGTTSYYGSYNTAVGIGLEVSGWW